MFSVFSLEIIAIIVAFGIGIAIVRAQRKCREEAKEIIEGKKPVPDVERLNKLIDTILKGRGKKGTLKEEDRDLVEGLRELKRQK